MKSEQEIQDRLEELRDDRETFSKYGPPDHNEFDAIREIQDEIKVLEWVLDEDE